MHHIMECILTLKHMPKRLTLVLYGCCLSMFFFCAFYTYTATHSSSTRPVEDHILPKNAEKIIQSEKTNQYSTNIQPQNTENIGDSRIINDPSYDKEHTPKSVQLTEHSIGADDSQSTINSSILGFKNKNILMSDHLATVQETPNSFDELGSGQDHVMVAKTKQSAVQEHLPTTCETKKTKLILLWTPFFGYPNYLTSSSFSHCKGCHTCLVTTDKSKLLESDAVIFHARDLSLAELPGHRLPHQRWIFYCLESPPYSDFPGLQFTHKMFNWTMTYRTDSDIISDYGYVTKLHPSKTMDWTILRETWRQKSRSVVWMSSHCPTHGGRDEYVDELKKYIDVDEFGYCGQLDCPVNSTVECMKNFAKTYKFFLAFENSICKDYVTEKFFRTLSYNIVPVVFGGGSYHKVAPPGSYIEALSFKSPKHLAFFLKGVGQDFNFYMTYFEWRKDFAVRLDNRRDCVLCSSLHQDNSKDKVYDDMRKWWVQDQCRIWKPKE